VASGWWWPGDTAAVTNEVEWGAAWLAMGVRRGGEEAHSTTRDTAWWGKGARRDGLGRADASLKKRQNKRQCQWRLRNEWIRTNVENEWLR